NGEGYPVQVGGTQIAKVTQPAGVFFDRTGGQLYFADTNQYMVRKVSTNYNVYAVAGDGTSGINATVLAEGASMVAPEGVAADSSGNVYIADKGDNRIRKWYADTLEIATVVGTGLAGS